jgi:hypothetical protein
VLLDPLPAARGAALAAAAVAESLRQVAPRYSGAVSIQNHLDEAAIIAGGCTDITGLAGKQL